MVHFITLNLRILTIYLQILFIISKCINRSSLVLTQFIGVNTVNFWSPFICVTISGIQSKISNLIIVIMLKKKYKEDREDRIITFFPILCLSRLLVFP